MNSPFASHRLVEIENPFQQWTDPRVRALFERTMTLKFAGCGPMYAKGALPVDSYTWITNHYLLCPGQDEADPIMTVNRTSLARCSDHYLPFPVVSIFKQIGSERHLRKLDSLMARYRSSPEKLSYLGGFAIDPPLRENRHLVEELQRLMVAIQYLAQADHGEGHLIVTAPSVRLKLELFLKEYGFIPFLDDVDEESATVTLPSFASEPVLFMVGDRFNERMLELAEQYRPLWRDRLIYRPQNSA